MSGNSAGLPVKPALSVETGDRVSPMLPHELESRPHSLSERAQSSPRSLNAKLVVVRSREPSASDDVPAEAPRAGGSVEPLAVQDFDDREGMPRHGPY